MDQTSDGFGSCGIKEIGPDRYRRVNPEQHDEYRRHQCATADPGHANQEADGKARQRIQRINHWNDLVATGPPGPF